MRGNHTIDLMTDWPMAVYEASLRFFLDWTMTYMSRALPRVRCRAVEQMDTF